MKEKNMDFKLAIAAKNYLENPSDEILKQFKEELSHSSSLSMASELGYLNNQLTKEDNNENVVKLIELIKNQFNLGQEKSIDFDVKNVEFNLLDIVNDYIENGNGTVEEIKEEITKNGILPIAGVLNNIINKSESDEEKQERKQEIMNIILKELEPLKKQYGIYDPSIGEIVYEGESNKSRKM